MLRSFKKSILAAHRSTTSPTALIDYFAKLGQSSTTKDRGLVGKKLETEQTSMARGMNLVICFGRRSLFWAAFRHKQNDGKRLSCDSDTMHDRIVASRDQKPIALGTSCEIQ
jgi:hypothetical protein